MSDKAEPTTRVRAWRPGQVRYAHIPGTYRYGWNGTTFEVVASDIGDKYWNVKALEDGATWLIHSDQPSDLVGDGHGND